MPSPLVVQSMAAVVDAVRNYGADAAVEMPAGVRVVQDRGFGSNSGAAGALADTNGFDLGNGDIAELNIYATSGGAAHDNNQTYQAIRQQLEQGDLTSIPVDLATCSPNPDLPINLVCPLAAPVAG